MLTDFIWDFDGMLCDSYPHITTAFMRAWEQKGRTDIDYETCYGLFKQSFRLACEHYETDSTTGLLFRALESDFTQSPPVTLFPGIKETLETIVARGGHNYINTFRDSLALTHLHRLGVLHLFTDAVTSESPVPHKPHAESVLYFVDRYHLDKDSTVMLGDREVDILTGIHAGVKTCLFDQFGDQSDIVCDYRVLDTRELLSVLF